MLSRFTYRTALNRCEVSTFATGGLDECDVETSVQTVRLIAAVKLAPTSGKPNAHSIRDQGHVRGSRQLR